MTLDVATKSKPVELTFSPTDNERLANLCGALDENLKQVEYAFNVMISRRGGHFKLYGSVEHTHLAIQALKKIL